MKKSFQLIESILGGVWAINPDAANTYLPFVGRLIQGQITEASFPSSNLITRVDHSNSNAGVSGVLGMIAIKSPIVKYDTWCDYGTESMANWVNELAKDPSIDAIILDIDSPGGSTGAVSVLTEAITNARKSKPVIAYVGNGATASAAYWIASFCDEIYASYETDMVGSIGTYATLADYKEYYEKMGIALHEIYATRSTEKNGVVREAFKGNYEPMKKEMIDPLNNLFINDIKANRPDVKEEVFTGKMYLAKEAQALGLIDGMMSLDQVKERALEKKSEINSNTNKSMFGSKFKSLEAFAKKAVSERTAEDIQAVNEELKANGIDMVMVGSADHSLLVADAGKVAELTSKVTAFEASEKTSNEKITALEKEVGELKAIVPPTTTSKKEGDDKVEEKEDAFPLTEADERLAAERKRLKIGE